ncbi:MAG: hypothetical protein K2X86_02075 [Cytophagaceae bacterium]|nr:hypothetical protein [Cytophagaceae bacterium]
MTEEKLHIISFDIPFPPNYGGVIDIFYKIQSLKEAGIKIHLHCFEYGRKHSEELERLCEKVYYYKRGSIAKAFSSLPYIVFSRQSTVLIDKLISLNFPILFEGLHCCYYLSHPALTNRKKIVRIHNVEHAYYYNLFKAETNLSKKIYFLAEAFKLRRFQKILKHASALLSINLNETNYFKKIYPDKNIVFVPPFVKYTSTNIKTGKGSYVLFHGNLSVAENKKAALYLIQKVSYSKELPLIIAGKDPDEDIQNACTAHNIALIPNPDEDKMLDLIRNAHINLLISFQNTGNKLKLFSALYNGRHCIVNSAIADSSKLNKLFHSANTPAEIRKKIEELAGVSFNEADIKIREGVLSETASNTKSAAMIKEIL